MNELSPISPHVTYADGWEEVIINANQAKTKIGVGAHFGTNRNACGRDAYGSIQLEDWNMFAKYMNAAMKGQFSSEETCLDSPDTRFMDGITEVKTGEQKKVIYEYKGGMICTTIADPEVSKNLLKVINSLVIQADKEDCPNGWGS